MEVQRIFAEEPSLRLAGLFVWVPMLGEDDRGAAEERRRMVTDPRVEGWWDGDRAAEATFARTLGVADAWDVYLLYPAGARWGSGDSPVPALWMHQLDDAPAELRLDGARLEREVRRLVAGRD